MVHVSLLSGDFGQVTWVWRRWYIWKITLWVCVKAVGLFLLLRFNFALYPWGGTSYTSYKMSAILYYIWWYINGGNTGWFLSSVGFFQAITIDPKSLVNRHPRHPYHPCMAYIYLHLPTLTIINISHFMQVNIPRRSIWIYIIYTIHGWYSEQVIHVHIQDMFLTARCDCSTAVPLGIR